MEQEPRDVLQARGYTLVDSEQLADALRFSGIEPAQFALALGAPAALGERWCEREISTGWLVEIRRVFPSVQHTIPRKERHLYLSWNMELAGISVDELVMRLGVRRHVFLMWITGESYPNNHFLRALLREFPDLYTRD